MSTLSDYFKTQSPRYTSYPPATQFNPLISQADRNHWISTIESSQTISLYIHIPYCHSLCTFCACNMQVLHKESQIEHYIHALINEINTTASLVSNDVVVRNIHFGGGTPSILSCSQLKTIMHEINRCFHVSAGASIAMEIEPRGFKKNLAKTLVNEGFNRISFGVQDFDNRVQKTINRIQSFELVDDVVSQCRLREDVRGP